MWYGIAGSCQYYPNLILIEYDLNMPVFTKNVSIFLLNLSEA